MTAPHGPADTHIYVEWGRRTRGSKCLEWDQVGSYRINVSRVGVSLVASQDDATSVSVHVGGAQQTATALPAATMRNRAPYHVW